MYAVRWGDNDRYFGPFTFAWCRSDNYRPFAIILKSWGGGDANDAPASLRISLIWFSILIRLPPVVRPQRRKVYPNWDEATVARLGRNWYWDVEVREYGFSYCNGFLLVSYGINPCDSCRDQTWGKHLPWTQWRHIRRSFYGLGAEHVWSELERETDNYRRMSRLGRPETMSDRWELVRKWEELCPKARFRFKDFDGEEIIATTHIEEREWRFGTGWFKWLSWFRQPKIRRSLVLNFSSEVGPEKGSWKGGTLGHSIEMLPLELHEAAFRRYCQQDHRSKYRPFRIEFIGVFS